MGGYVISVNRFLSLTLCHHSPSVMSPCIPTPFLPLNFRSHAFFRPFPPGLWLCSALSFVWLVAGDGQH